jgi:hypothetical protein
MENIIDVDQVVNEIKAIVEENPFFEYPLYQFCDCDELTGTEDECDFHLNEGCRYFNTDNRPQCVVGHWLDGHNLNTPESFGVQYINEMEGSNASEVLDRVQQNNDFVVSDDARDFLTLVQQSQDTGMAWVDAFNNNLPEELKSEKLGE